MKREWTDNMEEISGFGGTYEAACQAMLLAALDWLDAHPEADPKYKGYTNVFGLVMDDNEDAKALDTVMVEAAEALGDSPTGAMHHAVVNHMMFVRKNGWDAYVKEMTKAPGNKPVDPIKDTIGAAAEAMSTAPAEPATISWWGLPEKLIALVLCLILMLGFIIPALISAPNTTLTVIGGLLLVGTIYATFKVVQHIYKGTKA